MHGVSTRDIVETLRVAVSGAVPASVHLPHERQPLMVRMVLPRQMRSRMFAACDLPMKGATGNIVPLAELVTVKKVPEHQPIYHKNLAPVVYVMGEMAGRAPARGHFGHAGPAGGESAASRHQRPVGRGRGMENHPAGVPGTWASPLPRPWWGFTSF